MTPDNGTMTNTQFSVFLGSKPLSLAKICNKLAEHKINITAMCMMDSAEHGVLRLVVAHPERARTALAALDMSAAETTVLIATLPNHPGALADVVQRLSTNHVDVSYAYCTSGAPGGKTVGVFRVSNLPKAVKILTERKTKRKTSPAVRKSVVHRR